MRNPPGDRNGAAPKEPAGTAAGKERPEGSFGRSVRRALEVIELLRSSEQPLSAGSIIRRLGLPRSTGYELIRILQTAEYIERQKEGAAYGLGRQLHILGMAYRERVDLLKDGAPVAEALRDATGETVQLCVLDNDHLLVLLKEDGSRPLRIISRVGSRVPVNWGASGRLLVSDHSDAALRALLGRTARPSPVTRKPVDIPGFIRQVRQFRERGWAFELNETNEHAGCVAAPILDGSGHCIATLSIVAPEQRLSEDRLPPLVEAVQAAAAQLSRRLGGVARPGPDSSWPPSARRPRRAALPA